MEALSSKLGVFTEIDVNKLENLGRFQQDTDCTLEIVREGYIFQRIIHKVRL